MNSIVIPVNRMGLIDASRMESQIGESISTEAEDWGEPGDRHFIHGARTSRGTRSPLQDDPAPKGTDAK